MEFFIPNGSGEYAEVIYQGIKEFAKETMGWPVNDRRIYSIDFYDGKKRCHLEVGKSAPMTGESVVAILESNSFLVCTPNRGVARGMPIMVGKQEVFSVREFEA